MKKKTKVIVLCASVSHYKELIEIEKKLKDLGFKVLVPDTLRSMQKTGNFDPNLHKTWFKNKKDYHIKTKYILAHFKKIEMSDAILIGNFKKNGMDGYIGGNVLMEMTVAFYLKKPIFIYNNISENLPIKEEVYGMDPIFINENLGKVKF